MVVGLRYALFLLGRHYSSAAIRWKWRVDNSLPSQPTRPHFHALYCVKDKWTCPWASEACLPTRPVKCLSIYALAHRSARIPSINTYQLGMRLRPPLKPATQSPCCSDFNS